MICLRRKFTKVFDLFVLKNFTITSKDTSYFCGHCKEYLGKSTFYKHKKRYYNHSSRTWQLINSAKTCGATLLIDQDDILFDDDLLEESLSELQGFFGTFFIMFSLCYFISWYILIRGCSGASDKRNTLYKLNNLCELTKVSQISNFGFSHSK